jgi:hypothetical protein
LVEAAMGRPADAAEQRRAATAPGPTDESDMAPTADPAAQSDPAQPA